MATETNFADLANKTADKVGEAIKAGVANDPKKSGEAKTKLEHWGFDR